MLERFVVDRSTWRPIGYDGEQGIGRLMAELAKAYGEEDGQAPADERLMGMSGSITVDGHDAPIRIRISVGAGSQLCLAVGPSRDTRALRDAIRGFDRQFHIAITAMTCDYELVAQGYHPGIFDPSEVELAPSEAYRATDAYLTRRRGRGRELLRCTAATRVRIPIEDARHAMRLYQLLVALCPVLAFLTDNTLHVRGSEAFLTPPLSRMRIAAESVPERTDIPDDIFGEDADLELYQQWLEGIRPLYLTTSNGETISTGADTIEQLMCDRELTPGEAARLLHASWAAVRLLAGRIELSCSDALPPRLAGAYLALLKGLTGSEKARTSAARLVDLPALDEAAVLAAWDTLRRDGWNAQAYGHQILELANDLADVASGGLDDIEERRMLAELTQLWEVECAPRDLAQVSPDPELPRTHEQELMDLYGEGVFSPFEEVDADLPSGSTAILRFRHLF